MNSKQQDNVLKTAKQEAGAKNSAYGNQLIAPNGDKISVAGNVTQIGSKKLHGEQSALDTLRKMNK